MSSIAKLPECDRCLNSAHSNYLICAIHPKGIDGKSCPDFQADGIADELWCPDGYTFDEQQQLVKLPVIYETDHVSQLTRAQQYQIFMTHPMFTGMCPQCRYVYEANSDCLDWNCPLCGWQSD